MIYWDHESETLISNFRGKAIILELVDRTVYLRPRYVLRIRLLGQGCTGKTLVFSRGTYRRLDAPMQYDVRARLLRKISTFTSYRFTCIRVK